ncbi:MAG: alpha/beta hydrolase [Promethearchaeota archaeon]
MMEEKILISRSVGGTLSAVIYTTPEPFVFGEKEKAPLIIMCHGFTGDKYEWGRYPRAAKIFNEEGFDALIFDFSGSGENEREVVTLSKQVMDLTDVHFWAKEQGYTWIALLGLSFGGLTVLVSNLPDIKTMVLWAPVLNYRETFEDKKLNLFKVLDNLRKRPLKLPSSGMGGKILIDKSFSEDLLNFDVDSLLRVHEIPTIIIQGIEDSVVKAESTRSAFSLLPLDKGHQLIEIKGAPHDFDNEHLEQFINVSLEWLKRIRRKIE